MTSQNVEPLSDSQICENVRHLGYVTSARIRLYGEEFEVLSEPFPEAGGVAVRAKAKKDSTVRVLRLPSTIIQSVKGRTAKQRVA